MKVKPQRNRNIVVPTVYYLSKQNIYQIIHQRFGRVSIFRLKLIAIKVLMKGLPKNILDLEEPCPLFILTKATKISRGLIIDVSNFPPGFMLHMDFAFFNVEIIRGFISTFVAICSDTSYLFGFPFIIKLPHFGFLKFLSNTLRNQYKKVALIRVA